MTIYRTRAQARAYGHELGVLLIDCQQPFVPGDVGNASTWPFPVLYHMVAGCTIDRLIHQGDMALVESVVEAARHLEAEGVRGITSNCGFMLRFQEHVAGAVDVPVFLSSLLQLPQILSGFGNRRPVAVVTASGRGLSPDLLAKVHVSAQDPVFVYGMDAYPAFDEPYMQDSGVVDTEAMEAAAADLAQRILDEHPNLGGVLLECADLPPYAHIFQKVTRRPVFDFTTMVHYFVGAQRRTAFAGHY